jgi:hypothetical protein
VTISLSKGWAQLELQSAGAAGLQGVLWSGFWKYLIE